LSVQQVDAFIDALSADDFKLPLPLRPLLQMRLRCTRKKGLASDLQGVPAGIETFQELFEYYMEQRRAQPGDQYPAFGGKCFELFISTYERVHPAIQWKYWLANPLASPEQRANGFYLFHSPGRVSSLEGEIKGYQDTLSLLPYQDQLGISRITPQDMAETCILMLLMAHVSYTEKQFQDTEKQTALELYMSHMKRDNSFFLAPLKEYLEQADAASPWVYGDLARALLAKGTSEALCTDHALALLRQARQPPSPPPPPPPLLASLSDEREFPKLSRVQAPLAASHTRPSQAWGKVPTSKHSSPPKPSATSKHSSPPKPSAPAAAKAQDSAAAVTNRFQGLDIED